MNKYLIFVALVLALSLSLTAAEESCEESLKHIYPYLYQNGYYYLWNVWSSDIWYWYNMTTWNGHTQIPEKDSVASECFMSWGNVLVLTEKHPDIEDINEYIVKVQACNLNENRRCAGNRNVLIRKCNNNLLYSFPSFEQTDGDTFDNFICFDRIYTEISCKNATLLQPKMDRLDNILKLSPDYEYGWIDAFIERRQYVLPSIEDIELIFEKCSLSNEYDWHYFLQDPLPSNIGEEPRRLVVCYVYRIDGAIRVSYDDNGKCDNFIYVRSCNGKLLFDLSVAYFQNDICLIYHSNVKVQPEIDHEETVIIKDGREVTLFSPIQQYRCSFDILDDTQYKVNWYINGTFQIQTGPSSNLDDLVFREKYLTNLTDGYEVSCGVFPALENETMEAFSNAYFAGWKIPNKDISLSKSGVATVTVEQTIPIGCSYTTDFAADCLEAISFDDLEQKAEKCDGIKVKNSDDPNKSFIELKTLKKGEKWTKKKYSLLLSTIDNDYDDKTTFDLQLTLSFNSNVNIGRPITSKRVGEVQVKISNINRHWSKRCYSHVDPHMKTVDGLHYEAQREGDYMLLQNEKYQTEIQTSARYCSPGYERGPVCACGIAIAVGADTFIINRCHDQRFKFDLTCKDGGIIDIKRVHDYRYMVRTPIGTIVEINLLNWNNVMNIDVYMSPKDFGNMAGLCGNFDGEGTNDLEHRDGTISYDANRSYKFADSWRLTDEENLFKNPNRKLDHWGENNAGYIGGSCGQINSITRNKCKIKRRKRRSIPERLEMKLKKQYYSFLSRQKRSESSFTEDEAFQLCNRSIYSTPAVRDFPDKLAEEDPEIVVEQCVYDLMQGNDTTWVDAHVSALNNAADTILMLNPVFVANNTDKVNSYRSQTCLNNCSGNGICADTGLCECSGVFRGPDCSIDIRIPPVVYDIEGDGVCTITDDDDCTCFQIRTDNIFDGFVCKISENKMYLNGSSVEGNNLNEQGHYEDIFTGECCTSTGRRKRSSVFKEETEDISVIMYQFSISNDGVNYGETNSVFIYDTTCIQQVETNEIVTFRLKDRYCFIDESCVAENLKVSDSSACFFCDPATDQYSWTKGKCEDSSKNLGTGAIVGIVVGSVTLITVTAALMFILTCKVLKKNSSSIGIQPKIKTDSRLKQNNAALGKGITSYVNDVAKNSMTSVSEPRCFSPAKQRFERNMWIGTNHQRHLDSEMKGCENISSTRESVERLTHINNYVNRDTGQSLDKEKAKRDISFINLELD